jgi:hypothetical protein
LPDGGAAIAADAASVTITSAMSRALIANFVLTPV